MFKPSLAVLGQASPRCRVDREGWQAAGSGEVPAPAAACAGTGTTHPWPVPQPTPGQRRWEAAAGQGVECGLGAAVPARGAPEGFGLGKERGAGGSAPHHPHSNTSPFTNSNYFLFPFIVINTWRLRWIKYWILLSIYINVDTHTYVSLTYIHMHRDIPRLPPTSQIFFLAQYGPRMNWCSGDPHRADGGKSTEPRGWFLCW